MNTFDTQRIENAIWTLLQYEYELKDYIKETDIPIWDLEKTISVLETIKNKVSKA